ncbi:MAG: DUF4190 domain-containing protein [Actinomycetia bacterium]|nr:DUF4190 domain-containing protein [Actinomycetes bacterium]MCH9801771.1 DUF4190 domain-containing protein [Actinomycetes bacterium]
MSETPPPPLPDDNAPMPPTGPVPAGSALPKNNGLAIASLICGILGLISCGFTLIISLAAILLGAVGRGQIRRSAGQQQGEGMAITGLILGIVGFVMGLITLAILIPVVLNQNV